MSVLSVQSVSYSYKTKYQTVQAVKDVSCDLSAGTFYALVGKSGSGKTTLLSLLAGLDTPQSGDIIVGGQSLREIDVDIYRRKQASVIYQSYNLFPLMTVCENVMYPLKLLRHSDADAKKEAQIALEKVGLGESYWNNSHPGRTRDCHPICHGRSTLFWYECRGNYSLLDGNWKKRNPITTGG